MISVFSSMVLIAGLWYLAWQLGAEETRNKQTETSLRKRIADLETQLRRQKATINIIPLSEDQ